MQRRAIAVWQGEVKIGQGSVSTKSRVLEQAQYSFNTRFRNFIGTNPGELLAAAHAGCFAMALSTPLGKAGLIPQSLEATATITPEKVGEHHAITKSHLDLPAHVPRAQEPVFAAAVPAAETGCPVSKPFRAEISVDTRLEASN